MVGARLRDEFVIRSSPEFRLGDFLEFRFGVDMERSLEDVVGFEEDVFGDEFAYRFESRIEIERSEERLEGVGEDIGVLISPGEGFPTGKEDDFAEPDAFRSLGEVLASDEGRTDVGHFAFGLLGEFLIEEFGGYEFENGVAQKFETFVGFRKIVFVEYRPVNERRHECLDRGFYSEAPEHFGNLVFESVPIEAECFFGHRPAVMD